MHRVQVFHNLHKEGKKDGDEGESGEIFPAMVYEGESSHSGRVCGRGFRFVRWFIFVGPKLTVESLRGWGSI
jgi:hypothetical protein